MTTSTNGGQAAAPATSTDAGPDLEKIPVEQVLAKLDVKADKGLTGDEAQKRLAQYGPNAIVEKEKSLAAKIIGYFMGPIAYMIEAAANDSNDPTITTADNRVSVWVIPTNEELMIARHTLALAPPMSA